MATKKVASKEDFERCKDAVKRAKKKEFTVDDFLAEMHQDICELHNEFGMSIMSIAKLLAENGAPATAGSLKPKISEKLKDCDKFEIDGNQEENKEEAQEDVTPEKSEDKTDDGHEKETGKKPEEKTGEAKPTTQQIAEKHKGKKTDGGDKDLQDPDFDNL